MDADQVARSLTCLYLHSNGRTLKLSDFAAIFAEMLYAETSEIDRRRMVKVATSYLKELNS